jgi:hypothetical protein
MNAKKILIAGDSWGCGEWEFNSSKDTILHKGLEQYLSDAGHIVHNISIDGASNSDILSSLVGKKDFDYVFVFVTDTHRDVSNNEFWKKQFSYQDYLNRHRLLISDFVNKLDKLDKDNIYLLGGLTKVTTTDVVNTKINIAIDSVLELIIPGLTQFEILFRGKLWLLNDIKNVKNVSPNVVDNVYQEDSVLTEITKHPIMYPDTHHPNRHGHKIIFDYLTEKYKL